MNPIRKQITDLCLLSTAEGQQFCLQNAQVPVERVTLASQIPVEWRHAYGAYREGLAKASTANALLPPLQLAMATDETASRLAFRGLSGERAADLTAGLGFDAVALSKGFQSVDAIELEPALGTLAACNLRRLGIENVRWQTANCIDWLHAQPTAGRFELLFLDPARREGANRLGVRLADHTPNVASIWPLLLQKAHHIVLKLSPLFDVTALLQEVPHLQAVEVISVRGEVKGVYAHVGAAEKKEHPSLRAVGHRPATGDFIFERETADRQLLYTESGQYLLQADAAIYKAELLPEVAKHYQARATGPQGFLVSDTYPEGFPGHVYAVLESGPYKPKALARSLKRRSVKQAHLHTRRFPVPVRELLRQLNLRPNGALHFAFTTLANGQKWVYETKWLA